MHDTYITLAIDKTEQIINFPYTNSTNTSFYHKHHDYHGLYSLTMEITKQKLIFKKTSTDIISILPHIIWVSSTHSVYIFCSSSMNVVIVKFQLHGPAFRCVKTLIDIQFSTLTKCYVKISALLILAFGWLYTSLRFIYLI